MTSGSDIWVGDLVRAVRAVADANEATLDAIATLLGLAGIPRDRSLTPKREESIPAGGAAGAAADDRSRLPMGPDVVQDIVEVLDPVATEAPIAPRTWDSLDVLEPPAHPDGVFELTHNPLFDSRWEREIAVAMAAQPLPLGLVDARALVRSAARGLPIMRVTRRSRWSVSRGVQLLIDSSSGMEPFRTDQASFAAVLKSVIGAARLDVVQFSNAPLRGVYAGADRLRQPYRPPGPGVPVLVLTDLGLGGPLADAARATAAEWHAFDSALADMPRRVIALVPYPVEGNAHGHHEVMRTLHWGRSVTYQETREAAIGLPRRRPPVCTAGPAGAQSATQADLPIRAHQLSVLLSPAVFIEPELLRATRLAVTPASGPEIEAAVWFGPNVRTRNASGIVFGRQAAETLRTTLREWWQSEPARRPPLERAREVLGWLHRHQSPALRLEERLAWQVVTGDLAGAERELERALHAYTQGGRPGIAAWAAQAWGRLPSAVRATRAGWLFHQLARTASRRQPLPGPVSTPQVRPEDLAAALAFVPDVKIGVRRRDRVLELGNLSGEGAAAIMVPDTEPRVLDVVIAPANEVDHRIEVNIRSDEFSVIDVGRGAVRIKTPRGHVYELPGLSVAPSPPVTSGQDLKSGSFDDEHGWDRLLARVEEGDVVPVIGRDLLWVEDRGESISLYTWLAERVAARLGIPFDVATQAADPLNEVASRYLISGGDPRRIYVSVFEAAKELSTRATPEALVKLAEIAQFTLFVTTIFDANLQRAIDIVRFSGLPRTTVLSFAPNRPRDLPSGFADRSEPTVYHLLGRVSPLADFVVTEEDALEWMHGLVQAPPDELINHLRHKDLLLIGRPFPLELARSFIRLARGQRLLLSSRDRMVFIVDSAAQKDLELIRFLATFRASHYVFDHIGSVEFVDELHRRWQQRR